MEYYCLKGNDILTKYFELCFEKDVDKDLRNDMKHFDS